jgi:hypothetical protein
MARSRPTIPSWSIPIIYWVVTIAAGLVLPRLEYRYLTGFRHGMSTAVAIAVFSSVASGMLALTGIVFSLAFVMVQFSSLAYSPRLVLWFSKDPVISHGMGIFTATLVFPSALAWVDRNGDGRVPTSRRGSSPSDRGQRHDFGSALVQRLATLKCREWAFVGRKDGRYWGDTCAFRS